MLPGSVRKRLLVSSGLISNRFWPYFHFVHSCYVLPSEEPMAIARTDDGTSFVSVAGRDNLLATQFHPEESQRHSLKLFKNFTNF